MRGSGGTQAHARTHGEGGQEDSPVPEEAPLESQVQTGPGGTQHTSTSQPPPLTHSKATPEGTETSSHLFVVSRQVTPGLVKVS